MNKEYLKAEPKKRIQYRNWIVLFPDTRPAMMRFAFELNIATMKEITKARRNMAMKIRIFDGKSSGEDIEYSEQYFVGVKSAG